MRYKQSKSIGKHIEKGKKFITLCHQAPDYDSVISCLLLKKKLEEKGKRVDIYSFDDLGINNEFLDPGNIINIGNPNELDLSEYDYLIALDANDFRRYGIESDQVPVPVINIDHHDGSGCGIANLMDINAGGTATLLYYLFKDLKYKLDKDDVNKFLLAIIADTGIFHYSIYSSPIIFDTVSELITAGANYENALFYADQYFDVNQLLFWGEGINNLVIDKENRFVYSVIKYQEYKNYKDFGARTRDVVDKFLRKVRGTDFCFVIVERESGEAKISARTRTPGYHVLDFVKSLGGGGHITGGGAQVSKKSFNESVDYILETARSFSVNNKDKRGDD
jgi:nanoRNase/pAp phosphatase (c-di-AMP/oligoRNAs hydrolase)